MFQASTSCPVRSALATNRQSYRHGQSVRATLVLQNVGDSAINVSPNANTDGITVSDGSTVVWRSSRIVSKGSTSQTVQPGGNMTMNAVWNGRPNQARS